MQLVHTIAWDLVRGKQCRRRERQEERGEKQGQKLDLLSTEATVETVLSILSPNPSQLPP